MKKKQWLYVIIWILVSITFSCATDDDDDTMSRYDRVVKFENDYNSRNASIGTNIHPSKGAAGNAIAVWDAMFSGGAADKQITLTSISSSNPVTATLNSFGYTNKSIEFGMLEDGKDNWKISSITIDGSGKF